jgi:hypothetical protein
MNKALNKIAALLETEDKNLVISVAIRALVENGIAVKDAYNAVLGQEAYEKLAGNVYDQLKAD